MHWPLVSSPQLRENVLFGTSRNCLALEHIPAAAAAAGDVRAAPTGGPANPTALNAKAPAPSRLSDEFPGSRTEREP
jgi:hypothetical protein